MTATPSGPRSTRSPSTAPTLEDGLTAAGAEALREVAALSREAGGGRGHARDGEHPACDGLVHRSVQPDGNARGDVEANHRAQSRHDCGHESRRERELAQRRAPSGDGPLTALAPRRMNRVCVREGRPLLNSRAHLATIRPSPFILLSNVLRTSRLRTRPVSRLGRGAACAIGMTSPGLERAVVVHEGLEHVDDPADLDRLAVHRPVVLRVSDERLVGVARHTPDELHRRKGPDSLELLARLLVGPGNMTSA